jgi:glycosyltransferase involved in cell wall biosynthesis
MNVLFAYGFCGLGGVETAVLNRAYALRRRGIGVTIFFRQFYGEGAIAFADLPHVRVGSHHINSLLKERFDVICVIDYPDFVPVVRREAPGAILLLETHSSLTTRLVDFHRLADDPAIAAVVVPSRYNREIVSRGSAAGRPIHVIQNGIDITRFRERPFEALTSRFGELTTRTVVLWVGRLEDEKNPHGFLTLSRDIAAIRDDAHFLCIGDAPQDADYSARLQQELPSAARKHYTFISTVPYDEMPLFYSLAASTGGCLVSTSRFESVPMIFLEAMACGCPILSTNVGGVTEILEDGVTAELFDIDDRETAVQAARRLIAADAEAHRRRVVERARAYVREHHSLEVAGDRFSALLHSVIERPHEPEEVAGAGQTPR